MSALSAEISPVGFASGTGAGLYEAVLLYPDELEADQRRTHVAPGSITDPVLRDVLAAFQDGLIHQLADIKTRLALPYARTSLAGQSPAMPDFAAVWVPTIYLVAPFVGAVAGPLVSTGSAVTIWGTHQVSSQVTSAIGALPGPTGLSPSVEAVGDVADWLGVPIADVLLASGIRKRTYQAWKKGKARRPRSASQGRLWELHQLAEDLVETMGQKGVMRWFAQDPARSQLLRVGDLDTLATQAYVTSTKPLPPWVGAGSLESHAITVKPVQVGPMDHSDVVEPDHGAHR